MSWTLAVLLCETRFNYRGKFGYVAWFYRVFGRQDEVHFTRMHGNQVPPCALAKAYRILLL